MQLSFPRGHIAAAVANRGIPCGCAAGRGRRPRLQWRVLTYETFCGGIFETNCYLLEAPEGSILFDAPDGACDWLVSKGATPKLLLLTHGHFDHVPDVAKIKRRFNCQIGCHAETAPMISDRDFFRSFGFELEIDPVGWGPKAQPRRWFDRLPCSPQASRRRIESSGE